MRVRYRIFVNRIFRPWASLVGLLVLAAFFLNIGVSRASWNVIFNEPNGKAFTACYFLNESVGFIAGQYKDGVLKTTDGGMTWVSTPLPHFPPIQSSTPGFYVEDTTFTISQILMTDELHGWLTCEPDRLSNVAPVYPGLYQTTDGGASWNPVVNVKESFSDVYQTPRALVVTSRDVYPGGTGYISLDNGATFSPALPITNGVDFVDNMNGVVTGYGSHIWSHTIDGGITWSALSPTDSIETWSVYGVKGTSWFFTASEQHNPNIPSPVRRSSDFGITWNTESQLPFRTTGHIAGFGFTLYVEVDQEGGDATIWPEKGLWRSKDSGKTWQSIGGPANNREDTRFFVTGCRGEVIYAFDAQGHVFKTTDGGDGSLPQFTLPTALSVDSIDVCSPRDTILSITDLGCDTVQIISASAPATPALDILNPTTGQPPVYPIIIGDSGGTANLELQLRSSAVGAYQTKVFLEIERAGFITYDTVTVQSALKFYNPLRLVANIQYDSAELCGTIDSALSITNDSCFSVQIVNSQLKYGTSFVMDTTFTNDSIPAYSTKSFPIRFAPTQTGKIVDSLVLNLIVLGKAVRVSYPITGVGKPDNPKLVLEDRFGNPLPNEINFDTITRCKDSTFAFTIFEQGCDSLYVSIQWLDSTKTKPPPFTQFHWFTPASQWLTSDDTVISGIEALPTVSGSYEGYLRISDSVKGGTATLVSLIPYSVFVKPGTRTLSVNDLVHNYDTITFCDEEDSVIPIVNLGCDTIHDSSVSVSGPNFMIVNPPKVPFVINPLDTFYITVRYLPVNSGQAMDTLTLVTDADSARVRQIPLLGYATPTDTVRFSAITPNTIVIPGDTATIIVMPNAKFKNNGLNSVTLSLSYNGDIMTPFETTNASSGMAGALKPFVGLEIPTSPKIRTLPITINGTNMTFDSATPILKIQFLITLSDSTSTDFHIASFVLNNGDNTFNKCLLGGTADTGSIALQFVCGDTDLYNVLRYGASWTISDGIVPISGVVHPNPVLEGTAISVPFTALRAVAVKIEIMNETGTVVYSNLSNVTQAGAAIYTIPGSVMRSGAYHYRLHPIDGGSAVVTGSFVVIR
jgi:hypothetical protein